MSPGRAYYYRVRADNCAGASVNSIVISVVTLPAAPAPSAATNVTKSGFTAHGSSVKGATSYRLDVATSSSFSRFVSGYPELRYWQRDELERNRCDCENDLLLPRRLPIANEAASTPMLAV